MAIFDHTYYAKVVSNGNVSLTITNNVKAWGWVKLIFGIILILAGFWDLLGGNLGTRRRRDRRGDQPALCSSRGYRTTRSGRSR